MTRKIVNWGLVAAFALLVLFIASQAFAQDIATPVGDTEVHVDLSEHVTWLLSGAFALFTAAWGVAKGLLPGPARWAIEVTQLDQVLENIVRSWLSQNSDKLSSKATFDVDLRNQAVRDMVAMALNTGNKFVKQNRGTLADKLHARLEKAIQDVAS